MPAADVARTVARLLLGAFLVAAGVAHFAATEEFLRQVPTFLPWREAIVLGSGVVEVVLGAALLAVPWIRGVRAGWLGWVVAAFFVVVFPGNVWQAVEGTSSFGLESAGARVVRLFFQPLLVVWALWCTRAWPRHGGRGAPPGASRDLAGGGVS